MLVAGYSMLVYWIPVTATRVLKPMQGCGM